MTNHFIRKTQEITSTIVTVVLYVLGGIYASVVGPWAVQLCENDVAKQQRDNVLNDIWADTPQTYSCDASSISIIWIMWIFWGALLLCASIWAAVEIGKAAESKGLNRGGFTFLGLIFPLISLAIVLSAREPRLGTPNSVEVDSSVVGRIMCQFCAELIMPEAKICRFCGRSLNHEPNDV